MQNPNWERCDLSRPFLTNLHRSVFLRDEGPLRKDNNLLQVAIVGRDWAGSHSSHGDWTWPFGCRSISQNKISRDDLTHAMSWLQPGTQLPLYGYIDLKIEIWMLIRCGNVKMWMFYLFSASRLWQAHFWVRCIAMAAVPRASHTRMKHCREAWVWGWLSAKLMTRPGYLFQNAALICHCMVASNEALVHSSMLLQTFFQRSKCLRHSGFIPKRMGLKRQCPRCPPWAKKCGM